MNNENKSGGNYLFLELIKRYYLPFGIIVYIGGFLAWNMYLGKFGFFEYNLLETRFLSAGLITTIPSISIYLIINYFINKFRNSITTMILKIFFLLVSLFTYFYIASSIFPRLPQYVGGAKPFISSIIINDNKGFFEKLGILNPNHAKGKEGIESNTGCLFYQNSNSVIIGFSTPESISDGNNLFLSFNNLRVITLNREIINALGNFNSESNSVIRINATATAAINTKKFICDPIFGSYK